MPGSHNVVFAVGFSGAFCISYDQSLIIQPGTGFKLGPVTGRMLADLAQVLIKLPKYNDFAPCQIPRLTLIGFEGGVYQNTPNLASFESAQGKERKQMEPKLALARLFAKGKL